MFFHRIATSYAYVNSIDYIIRGGWCSGYVDGQQAKHNPYIVNGGVIFFLWLSTMKSDIIHSTYKLPLNVGIKRESKRTFHISVSWSFNPLWNGQCYNKYKTRVYSPEGYFQYVYRIREGGSINICTYIVYRHNIKQMEAWTL